MATLLILYSTTDGHTRTICERLRDDLEGRAHRVTVADLAESLPGNMAVFDKIVIGASIRYGKHHPRVLRFIEAHRALLESKPNAFFSVNVVARKPEKNRPETNPYLRKFLRQTTWKPRRVAVFAGRLDYPALGWLDRSMIRFIMFLTKGPTDPQAVVEFTDWSQVAAFGREIGEM